MLSNIKGAKAGDLLYDTDGNVAIVSSVGYNEIMIVVDGNPPRQIGFLETWSRHPNPVADNKSKIILMIAIPLVVLLSLALAFSMLSKSK